ncbi:MAG: PAS domain S-box protein [Pseudomonadota bacterium]
MDLAHLKPKILSSAQVATNDLWELLERAADGVWLWNIADDELFWSPNFVALLGYSEASLADAPNLMGITHPDDRERHESIVRASYNAGGRYSAEFRLLRADSNPVWVSAWAIWHANPGEKPHTMLGIVRDISERVATRDQLEASESRFRAFFDQVPAAVYIKDEDCRHIYGNEIAARFAGTDLESFIGVTARELMYIETAEALIKADKEAMDGDETVTWVGPLRLPGDIADRQIWDTKFPIRGINGERMLGGVGIDVTELHETQRQLGIAQRLESVGLMASGVAHDFNNLLFAIAGNAELAMQHVPVEHRGNLESILAATEHASALCRQLLAIGGRAETDTGRQSIDLADLVRESAELLKLSLQAEHPLELNISEADCTVRANPDQVRQVLVNLVLNAKQASAPNTAITIELGQADLSSFVGRTGSNLHTWLAEDAGDGVFISVEDRGHGISKDRIDRIFDPYYTDSELGHGLGLATVFGVVKAVRGAIRVESEDGVGTRFDVFIPRVAPTEPDVAPITSIPLDTETAPGLQRILVIDDHEGIVAIVTAWLERLGMEVTSYTNSQLAADVLLSRASEFDAVISDVSMPDVGGLGILETVREQDSGKPVILASGYNDAVLKTGDDPRVWFLQKPYSLGELQRVLNEAAETPPSDDGQTNPELQKAVASMGDE